MIYQNTIRYCSLFCICLCWCHINSGCSRIWQPYKKAEDFVLYDLDGRRFYLTAQKGKIVLLNFWSVQCAPCIKELPQLQQLSQYFHDKGGTVVGICSKPLEETLIKSILAKNKIRYTNCIDVNNNITDRYGVTIVPTTFIIDHNGFIRYKTIGYMKENIEKYKKFILQLLNEREKKKK